MLTLIQQRLQRFKTPIVITFTALVLVACVVDNLKIIPIGVSEGVDDIRVSSPVKAHLTDGSTVIFQQGFWIKDGKLIGPGERYDIALQERTTVSEVRVEEVAAMESFQVEVDKMASTLATGAAVSVGTVTGLFLLKAIFGSCPTTYSMEDGDAVLQAESFSYSVVPRLEARDVDRLSARPVNGEIVLEVRNEALETHYINQLNLVEVAHSETQAAYPAPDGRLIVTDKPSTVNSAFETNGQDVTAALNQADGVAWQATDARLQELTPEDLTDHIDLSFNVPDGEDTALLLRFRNSLLNTVLFYDVMLKGLGYEALDWMGDQPLTMNMLRSARWYQEHMGMKVSVWDGHRYKVVAHVRDQGPIAWKEVAVPLGVGGGPDIKVRLTFIADNWRIDWAGVAHMHDADGRTIPVNNVVDGTPEQNIDAALADSDKRYLITRPGDKVKLKFLVGQAPEDESKTYFLAASGYYTEWMRKEWLQPGKVSKPVPTASNEAVWQAMQLWREKRDTFRHQFETTRIATR